MNKRAIFNSSRVANYKYIDLLMLMYFDKVLRKLHIFSSHPVVLKRCRSCRPAGQISRQTDYTLTVYNRFGVYI